MTQTIERLPEDLDFHRGAWLEAFIGACNLREAEGRTGAIRVLIQMWDKANNPALIFNRPPDEPL